MQKQDEKVGSIYKTYKLAKFRRIIGNRPVNKLNVRRLKDSFDKYGILMSPILVNDNWEVIDGQHRLSAAQMMPNGYIYYIIVPYGLEAVKTLNLNQNNWSNKEFMMSYADIGFSPYIRLKSFCKRNPDFSLSICIAMCSNIVTGSSYSLNNQYRGDQKKYNIKEVFKEGTWEGKDFELAQQWADQLRLLSQYYKGYNRDSFVRAFIGVLKKEEFDFKEFIRKLQYQSSKLKDCTKVSEYKVLIEEIYNYKRREKVNLRF